MLRLHSALQNCKMLTKQLMFQLSLILVNNLQFIFHKSLSLMPSNICIALLKLQWYVRKRHRADDGKSIHYLYYQKLFPAKKLTLRISKSSLLSRVEMYLDHFWSTFETHFATRLKHVTLHSSLSSHPLNHFLNLSNKFWIMFDFFWRLFCIL